MADIFQRWPMLDKVMLLVVVGPWRGAGSQVWIMFLMYIRWWLVLVLRVLMLGVLVLLVYVLVLVRLSNRIRSV
jgi:hypothetical protein